MVEKLDKKDLRILSQLDMNARQSLTALAKKVGLSREVVSYRLERLIEKKIITGFYAIINTAKIGYLFVRLFVKLQNTDPEKEQEMLEWLMKHRSVGWVAEDAGVYDMGIVIWARSVVEAEQVLNQIFFRYAKNFQSRYVSIATAIYHFKKNCIYKTSDQREAFLGGDITDAKCDETDYKILGILARNARTPVVDIAVKTGISGNAVKYRIKDMKAKEVIQAFTVKINTALLGYQHFKVFLFLQNLTQKEYTRLLTYLKLKQEVIYITTAIGSAELEFELLSKSSTEFHEFVKSLWREFPAILKEYKFFEIHRENQINYLPMY